MNNTAQPKTLTLPTIIWQGIDFVNSFTLPERFWLAENRDLCIATKAQLFINRYERTKHKLYNADCEYVI